MPASRRSGESRPSAPTSSDAAKTPPVFELDPHPGPTALGLDDRRGGEMAQIGQLGDAREEGAA